MSTQDTENQSTRRGEAASGPSGAATAPRNPDRPVGYGEALARAFTQDRRFLVCFVVLVLGLIGVQALVAFGISFRKERVDLKAALTSLDLTKIRPYERVGSDIIPDEEVEALGTEEYVIWRLEDNSIGERGNPLRYVRVFITYYSGQPDQVPHVPEECFLGGGYQQLGKPLNTEITVPALEPKYGKIPLRVLSFRKESVIGGAHAPTVCYLFSVNGKFVSSRTDVRMALSNLFERYAYFSKVEVTFGRPGQKTEPEQVKAAAEKVLSKILPVLVEDHWPDWPPKKR